MLPLDKCHSLHLTFQLPYGVAGLHKDLPLQRLFHRPRDISMGLHLLCALHLPLFIIMEHMTPIKLMNHCHFQIQCYRGGKAMASTQWNCFKQLCRRCDI